MARYGAKAYTEEERALVDRLAEAFNAEPLDMDGVTRLYEEAFSDEARREQFKRLGRQLKRFVETRGAERRLEVEEELRRWNHVLYPPPPERPRITVCVDLDGVVVDYVGGMEALGLGPEDDGHEGAFLDMPPMPGAIEAVNALIGDPRFDVHFLSTAPWSNPSSWTDKRKWVERHFGEKMKKRLTLTHHKDRFVGDVLIDDRDANGSSDFSGRWIHFGSPAFPDWSAVLDDLMEEHLYLLDDVAIASRQVAAHNLVFALLSDGVLVDFPAALAKQGVHARSKNTSFPADHFVEYPLKDGSRFVLPFRLQHLDEEDLQAMAAAAGLSLRVVPLDHGWQHAQFLNKALKLLRDIGQYRHGDGVGHGAIQPMWHDRRGKTRWRGSGGKSLIPSTTLTDHFVEFLSDSQAHVITHAGPNLAGTRKGYRVVMDRNGTWHAEASNLYSMIS